MNATEFGSYLKSLRKKKGLTLTELGDLIGYSNPYLSQIENGKKGIPSPDILKKLAEPLGVSYAELMRKAGYFDDGSILVNEKLSSPKNQFIDSFMIFAANGFESEGVKFDGKQAKAIHQLMLKARDGATHHEITDFMNDTEITYNGHQLTGPDRQRIQNVLKELFPEYQKKAEENGNE